MKISLLQLKIMPTPQENIVRIASAVSDAVSRGAQIVVLPEMCCCEYSNPSFVANAMPSDSPFLYALSDIARENNIILVAGSVPELDEGKIYNTCFVFDKNGAVIAKHRKVHLFDIDVRNGMSFHESYTFSAGDCFTTFDTEWGKIGLIICFDIRFPDFIKHNSRDLTAIIVPASFNMTTGPAHWELLFRARAVDNQVFMIGCASASDPDSSYNSYGHSIVTDPWGDVVAQLGCEEGTLLCDLDVNMVEDIRAQLPLY